MCKNHKNNFFDKKSHFFTISKEITNFITLIHQTTRIFNKIQIFILPQAVKPTKILRHAPLFASAACNDCDKSKNVTIINFSLISFIFFSSSSFYFIMSSRRTLNCAIFFNKCEENWFDDGCQREMRKSNFMMGWTWDAINHFFWRFKGNWIYSKFWIL